MTEPDFQAHEMAEAFNTASPRKNWQANYSPKVVNFNDDSGMVQLSYDMTKHEFLVAFRKTTANFGDYANAIARSYVSVLSALEAAGMPFKAPKSPDGIEIVIKHNGIGNRVSVRYRDPELF